MIENPHSPEEKPCPAWLWTNAIGEQQHRTLDEFQPNEVLAVEAYSSPAVTPPDFAGSPCAAVMLWLKQSTSASVTVR
jgi:hypothetical protein